ncbi:serine/threonine-protein kinase pim-1-like [Eucyclogobius newberryi]|uniref:serine/threonine-protein kinase pim-1-like n=1 Tax=Eucyclogobius newberryi TaxID=166745 RepID=UPI003B5AB1D4
MCAFQAVQWSFLCGLEIMASTKLKTKRGNLRFKPRLGSASDWPTGGSDSGSRRSKSGHRLLYCIPSQTQQNCAISALEWKRYWTPEAQLSRAMRRLEMGSSDSEPVPGPSGLSQTSRAALGSDGCILSTKRKLKDTETITKEQAAQALNELYAKYKVINHLCDGGFGVIYAGVRFEDDFPVAVKMIKKHRVPFTEMEVNGAMCRLPLEVSLLIQVGAGPDSSGSNITPLLLDWYDLGSEIVLVMERPEPCLDLLTYITDRGTEKVDTEDVRCIFRQLVETAIEMKAKGVFHRDIKPDNVLIETGGKEIRARFIDFGCGTTFTPGQIFDEPQGTLQYAAPEFFTPSTYSEGPVTVWQLGILLYVMLFSRRPLVDERMIESWRIVPIPKSIPEECRHLLKSCLWKDPEARVSLERLGNHPWLNPQ